MRYGIEQIKQRALETLGLIIIIWIVFVLDRFLPLENFGILPRSVSGLAGIVAMPFLHADWQHITNNSVPLIVLLTILANSTKHYWSVIIGITVGSGLLLWLLGRSSLHIGASALVFGLIGYLLVAGLKRKDVTSLVATVLVFSLYGGTILSGISPLQTHVSWEGHLLGLLAGATLAWFSDKKQQLSY